MIAHPLGFILCERKRRESEIINLQSRRYEVYVEVIAGCEKINYERWKWKWRFNDEKEEM